MRGLALASVLVLAALPATARELSPDEIRKALIGANLSFSCLDRTSGSARYNPNGTATATLRIPVGDTFETERVTGQVKVTDDDGICVLFKGDVGCFRVVQTGARTYRATLAAGPRFWCDFTRN
jgi:hypothetical protein